MGSFRDILRTRPFLNGAHRGASAYAPENTLPAFELAVAQGAAVLEIDVRLTRDEEVVVIHDARVDRTADGQGEVQRMTLSEIQSLDAGHWFGESWTGTRIPTAEQVLERFAGRVLIDVDMKAGTEVRRLAAGHGQERVVVEDAAVSTLLARRTIEIATRTGVLDRVVLSGFGPCALAWLRKSVPEVLTQWAVVSVDIAEDAARAADEEFDVISPQMYAATRENIDAAHRRGLAVFIYAPDDAAAMVRLLDLDVEAVHVDRPDRLSAVLKDRQTRALRARGAAEVPEPSDPSS
jgi:glycerophosphoryl diester phosphodiesterase